MIYDFQNFWIFNPTFLGYFLKLDSRKKKLSKSFLKTASCQEKMAMKIGAVIGTTYIRIEFRF